MKKSFTNWVIQNIYPKTSVADNPKFRSQIGYLGGWSSIFVNLFLFIIKLIIGLASSSIALIADAFHTLSDLSTSIIIVIKLKPVNLFLVLQYKINMLKKLSRLLKIMD